MIAAIRSALTGLIFMAPIAALTNGFPLNAQLTANERGPAVGDAPLDPGPLASGLSSKMDIPSVQAAMRKVADWLNARITESPSQDWTFATLYLGLLAASDKLNDRKYHDTVQQVADHYHWTLGPRKAHADDQAIGQAYLWLNREHPEAERIASLRTQFDELMKGPDDPRKPVW